MSDRKVIIKLNLQFEDISNDDRLQKVQQFLTWCQIEKHDEIDVVQTITADKSFTCQAPSIMTDSSVNVDKQNKIRITSATKTASTTKLLLALATQTKPIFRKTLEELSGIIGQPLFSSCHILKRKNYITDVCIDGATAYQITDSGLKHIKTIADYFGIDIQQTENTSDEISTNCDRTCEKKQPTIIKNLPGLKTHVDRTVIKTLLDDKRVEDAYQTMFTRRIILTASDLTSEQRNILFRNGKNSMPLHSKPARIILQRLNMLNEIVPLTCGDSRYYPIHESIILVKYAPSNGKAMRCKYVVRYLDKISNRLDTILNNLSC